MDDNVAHKSCDAWRAGMTWGGEMGSEIYIFIKFINALCPRQWTTTTGYTMNGISYYNETGQPARKMRRALRMSGVMPIAIDVCWFCLLYAYFYAYGFSKDRGVHALMRSARTEWKLSDTTTATTTTTTTGRMVLGLCMGSKCFRCAHRQSGNTQTRA